MTSLNEILCELFQGHGVAAVLENDIVTFPDHPYRASAAIVQEFPQENWLSVQLDVRFEIAPGETIVESCGGMGNTREKATGDAIHGFVQNSFHVLLTAFFLPDDAQVSQETWTLDDSKIRVTLGNLAIRGTPPVTGEALVEPIRLFLQKLQSKRFVPGTHWVRLYYAQHAGQTAVCELLLNNRPWESLQSEMAAIEWPTGETFYSLRIFLVLQVEEGATHTPERVVLYVTGMISACTGCSQEQTYQILHQVLADEGFDSSLIDRAYAFTQMAWGRILLERTGAHFSSDYLCFDAEGRVVESGSLDEERFYTAARQIANRYVGTPEFRDLALSSADVNAINKAANSGTKPEELTGSPAMYFIERPTPSGLQNAQRVITEKMAARKAPPPAKAS